MGCPVHRHNMRTKRSTIGETPMKRFQTFVQTDETSDFHL